MLCNTCSSYMKKQQAAGRIKKNELMVDQKNKQKQKITSFTLEPTRIMY